MLVVLVVCSAGTFFMVNEDRQSGAGAQASGGPSGKGSGKPSPSVSPIDISSRVKDPKPLTVAQIFGKDMVVPDPDRPGYPLVKRDKAQADCRSVTTGQFRLLLVKAGCNQVLRATLLTSDSAYVATLGICNLRDATQAQAAYNAMLAAGRTGKGTFTGLPGPGAAAGIGKAPTLLGLESHGHYLLYVVIGLPSGKPITQDATTQRMMKELVEGYLADAIDSRPH